AYYGRLKPEPHFGYFCLFVSFFPQLVAGPIERSQSLLPQLKGLDLATKQQFRQGALLIMWGLMLKIVVADNLTQTITAIYFADSHYSVFMYWLAGLLVSFKIYCDFMAYSEIARGLALFFGVKLSKNFRRPFLAPNIYEFWQRWHVSLTRWIGVYINMPLARRFPKDPQRSLASIVTMTLIGLWHGASWNFVLFGVYHGVLLATWNPASRLASQFLKVGKVVSVVTSRLVLIFVWITGSTMFFIADFDKMIEVFRLMFQMTGASADPSYNIPYKLPLAKALLGLSLLTLYSFVAEYRKIETVDHVAQSTSVLRWTAFLGLSTVILLFGNFEVEDFVYFEF
ncbi:MAG: MBOAT family protein, partial [Granulosicoccus sp.]